MGTKRPAPPVGENGIDRLIEIMRRLRAPDGCPWDREQRHETLTRHAVEEVYELVDAIESGDDEEMCEELGDLLLQVVFHCQLAQEREAFDFGAVVRGINEKLIRRHPHVFGESDVEDVDGVWAQWEAIKKAEKSGTGRERNSALDGIPRHLPSLLKAEKLIKKAKKAALYDGLVDRESKDPPETSALGQRLFQLVAEAHEAGLSADEMLRQEIRLQEMKLREREEAKESRERAVGE